MRGEYCLKLQPIKKVHRHIAWNPQKINDEMVYGEVAKQSSQPSRRLCFRILPLATAYGKAFLSIHIAKKVIGFIFSSGLRLNIT